jgi:hypothetical protein
MQCKTNECVQCLRALNGFLLFAFLIVGCGRKEEKAAGGNTAELNPESAVVEKSSSEAEKLLQAQIAIFSQMAERYENATTLSKLKRQIAAISALSESLEKVKQQFNACPEEQKNAARALLKDELDQTLDRFKNAKNRPRKDA